MLAKKSGNDPGGGWFYSDKPEEINFKRFLCWHWGCWRRGGQHLPQTRAVPINPLPCSSAGTAPLVIAPKCCCLCPLQQRQGLITEKRCWDVLGLSLGAEHPSKGTVSHLQAARSSSCKEMGPQWSHRARERGQTWVRSVLVLALHFPCGFSRPLQQQSSESCTAA